MISQIMAILMENLKAVNLTFKRSDNSNNGNEDQEFSPNGFESLLKSLKVLGIYF